MAAQGNEPIRMLVVGESWIKHTIHQKGFDQFHTTEYEEGAGVFLKSFDSNDFDLTYVRAHEIGGKFPTDIAGLNRFDVIILSDIGANSFLLCEETFSRSERSVNRLELLAEFVREGGGLMMVGGYMSFSGIDGRARYQMSPLASVLPVEMLLVDDRVEKPEGLKAQVSAADHPALGSATSDWPILLGYNKFTAKNYAETLVSFEDDPILVLGAAGSGRAVAFASDVAPHWAPPEFMVWPHYHQLWRSVVRWTANRV